MQDKMFQLLAGRRSKPGKPAWEPFGHSLRIPGFGERKPIQEGGARRGSLPIIFKRKKEKRRVRTPSKIVPRRDFWEPSGGPTEPGAKRMASNRKV